ncbi:MAG: hypothetical protein QGH23_06285, partial [Dehalococcoidia bacterium]|nr:hypothetical protein [Dehalococcoidia bacterium]
LLRQLRDPGQAPRSPKPSTDDMHDTSIVSLMFLDESIAQPSYFIDEEELAQVLCANGAYVDIP